MYTVCINSKIKFKKKKILNDSPVRWLNKTEIKSPAINANYVAANTRFARSLIAPEPCGREIFAGIRDLPARESRMPAICRREKAECPRFSTGTGSCSLWKYIFISTPPIHTGSGDFQRLSDISRCTYGIGRKFGRPSRLLLQMPKRLYCISIIIFIIVSTRIYSTFKSLFFAGCTRIPSGILHSERPARNAIIGFYRNAFFLFFIIFPFPSASLRFFHRKSGSNQTKRHESFYFIFCTISNLLLDASRG